VPDETAGILGAARADLAGAGRILAARRKSCTQDGCPRCVSLAAHVARLGRQLGLLPGARNGELPAAGPGNEAMF
jgi:hypothetical protein